eukprot:INCI13478.7.p1 GENE.INCI13478.7~~INCI13478.7.p1  ORF type:complete len:122 (+),score=20.10 INCI13478.7:250-615(+)
MQQETLYEKSVLATACPPALIELIFLYLSSLFLFDNDICWRVLRWMVEMSPDGLDTVGRLDSLLPPFESKVSALCHAFPTFHSFIGKYPLFSSIEAAGFVVLRLDLSADAGLLPKTSANGT